MSDDGAPEGDDPHLEYAAAKEQGRRDAATAAQERAPADPLLRVAWASGWGQEDQVRAAVNSARGAGITWGRIAEALGENEATAETKYGTGYERQRRYRARKRGDT